MKHLFKKNQVIITTLVLMIAVAGYLNYSQTKEDLNLVSDESVETMTDAETLTDLSAEDLGQDVATVDDNGELVAENSTVSEGAVSTTSGAALKETQTSQDGEAILVSAGISSDYFSSAKLKREQTRAQNKESLLEIVNNKNLTDTEKKNAVTSMIALTEMSEKETAAEMLIGAKGFDQVIVNITNDEVDVILGCEEITAQQTAQVEDIVKRKTGFSSDHIVITPVSTKNAKE
ncbi:MAG: SpoIIIAH-like family protein [Clostridiales bacterium]|nr:SpoIIIAH-like family protein [Clostridiales bacterium]